MICRRCGGFVDTDDIICPACGALVDREEGPETGVKAIRQGKKGGAAAPAAQASAPTPRKRRAGASRPENVPQWANMDTTENAIPYVVEDTRATEGRAGRGSYGETLNGLPLMGSNAMQRKGRRRLHRVKRHMVNWAHVIIAIVLVLVLAVVGTYFYLDRTAEGQRILARMGRDATSTAMWEVGEEALDNGDLTQAIDNFLKARELDGADNVNVDGLLLLGTAYEAEGLTDAAMALYEEIYTTITPTRPEAYRNMIRLLEAVGRAPEAAELMQLAYEKTELATFRTMRNELLPSSPVADLTAGLYDQEKSLGILSAEGYDIYYTFNQDAQLPEDGVLYTGPITLTEGIYTLRAVTVLNDLVSDELTGTYKIIMPSPQTPRTSLAPNTYKQRQRIWLKPGLDNEKDTDITIYYTIDGSTPDGDSPVYTGEPFYLPGGGVTLRAVAVNGFQKASNTLEVYYMIEAKPYPLTGYTVEDTCNGLTLGVTTREDFQSQYGTGSGVEDVTLAGYDDGAQKYVYSWGYAVMGKAKSGWLLAELCFTSDQFSGPRSTGIGDTQDYVVGKFRDMGQVESPSGNRGLYETKDGGTGKIFVQEEGRKLIRYTAPTADNHTWQLDYCLNKSGVVDQIIMTYIP